MTVTPDMVIDTLNKHLGYRYGFDNRCTGITGAHDCSGYQVWMMNELGLSLPCTSSFAIASMCYSEGLMIGADEARSTKAVWAFHGRNGGRGPSYARNGSDGHIVCGAGDGTTREAMGHRYGVVVGPWDNRAWVAYAKIPGVDYSPPVPVEVDDVIVIQCSNKPAQNDGLDQPHAEFVPANAFFPKGGCILRNGASINNDLPAGKGERVFVPTLRAGSTKWVTMCLKPSGKGLTFIDDHGLTSGTNVGDWS